MDLKAWFSKLSPTWQHALAGGLMTAALIDESASQWLAAGHSLPFHITAGILGIAAWWIASAEKSILAASGSNSDSTSTPEKVG